MPSAPLVITALSTEPNPETRYICRSVIVGMIAVVDYRSGCFPALNLATSEAVPDAEADSEVAQVLEPSEHSSSRRLRLPGVFGSSPCGVAREGACSDTC